MRKLTLLVLFLFTIIIPAFAEQPCQLGTDFAVDVNRTIGTNEVTVVTPRPVVAVVAQRARPGSTHIVERRCEIPANEKLSCNSAQCWIERCGNAARDFVDWNPFVVMKGEPGEPGKAATVEVGLTTTGAPGTQAEVENVGTENAAVLDFKIPEGRPGVGCWDTNGNNTNDPSEDTNGDGRWDARDCHNLGEGMSLGKKVAWGAGIATGVAILVAVLKGGGGPDGPKGPDGNTGGNHP